MSFTLSTGNVVNASASAAITSDTATAATITVTASAGMTNGWVQSTGVVAIITINGSSSTKTVFGNGTRYDASSGTKSVTYAVSVAKGTAAKSVSWSVQFWQYTDGTQQTKKQTNSGTTSITAKTSYKIQYNANGGSGAPSAQTKWYGTALILSATKPTRTGYSFSKWNTASGGGGTNYASGASYTANAAATLYAQWTANTYTVSYNANGGSGAPGNQTKTYGKTLTLSSTKPTRTNYNFKGWATSASATTATYAAGASYTDNSAVTLYAVWELAYTPPKVTNLKAQRCTSNGTLNFEGTYYKLTFSWSCDQTIGSNTLLSAAYTQKLTTASSYGNVTLISASGTSGNVSIVAGGSCAVESSYDIQVMVSDTKGGATTVATTLPTAKFIIDILAQGNGVAFGKAASEDGFHCAWPATFDRVHITNTTDSSGTSDNDVALIVGNRSGAHISMDTNEINAKASGTTVAQLNLNADGGLVAVGGGGLASSGNAYTANAKYFGSENTSGTVRSLAIINSSNNTYFGNGSYANSEGSTYYQGNTIGIQAKGHIYMTAPSAGLSARAFGVNKVLASGGQYMNADHSWTLSEAVSAQPNGIVLVWSGYSNGSTNSDFSFDFVPKYMVAQHGSTIFNFFSANTSGNVAMCKALYISDTTIKGHANNVGTKTGSAITLSNSSRVLRYVLGV